jgi:PAS domain S-box-containing protein
VTTDPTDLAATIAEGVPYHVWVVRADGSIEYNNRQFLDYTGLSEEQALVDAHRSELVHPDDRDALVARWSTAFETQEACEMEFRLRGRDDRYRWFLARVAPLRDATGTVTRWVGTGVDIDGLRESAEWMRGFGETAPQLIWVSRPDGFVEFWNRRMIDFTGVAPDPQTGIDWARVLHPEDALPARDAYAYALAHGTSFEFQYRLRRHDGAYRWYLARAEPMRDAGGTPTRWFGSATDIEERKRSEDAMALLLDATEIIAGEREMDVTLVAVSELAVREFAETCSIYRPGADGRVDLSVLGSRDAERERAIRAMLRRYPPRAMDPVRIAMGRDEARMIVHVTDVERLAIAQDERHLAQLERLRTSSLIIAPLSARGQAFGVLHLARYGSSPPFDAQDLRTAQLLAGRLAGAMDEAQTRASERRLAETFQASALPSRLPAPPGIEIKAIYQAAEVGVNVGGDWYDAFEISPWRLVLSVGDVIGKGVNAAATMSLIRHGIRFAAQRGQEPAEILKAVDAALKAENPDLTATAFVAIMDIRESRIRYASAGHPPAALRLPLTGRTRLLEVEPAPPLGTWPDNTLPRVAAAPLAYGSLIAMYTDGLTEFDRDPIEGERLILEALRDEAAYASTNPARYLRDAVLGGRRVHDDVAVITLAFGRREGWTFEAPDAMEAEPARGAFGRWLENVADGDVYSATVIFGELVGNVVRHAPGPIEMRAEWQGSDLVLHVLDRGRGFAPSLELPVDGLSENGRGFFIVDALARRVDVTASRQGTHVRAVLPVTRKARAA